MNTSILAPFFLVLANRRFLLLWLSQITSQISLNMLSFVLAIRVYEVTKSNTAVSLMLFTFGIPAILFGFLAGGMVDRLDKRYVLFFANASRMVFIALFFFVESYIVWVYALATIISIVTQFFIPAEAPSIPKLVSHDQLLTANSLFTVSFFLSTLLGFILAGPSLRLFGEHGVYLVMAILMGCASIFVWQLPAIAPDLVQSSKGFFRDVFEAVSEGFAFVRTHPRIRQSLLLLTFSQALLATLSVLTPGFADTVLAIDVADASLVILGPAGVGLVIGALFVGAYGMRFLRGSLMVGGILLTGMTLLLLAVVTSPTFFPLSSFGLLLPVSLLLLLGWGNSCMTVPANTILQEESAAHMRGRIFGMLTSLTGGISLLPVLFSGLLADFIGVGRTLTVLGGFILMVGMFYTITRIK